MRPYYFFRTGDGPKRRNFLMQISREPRIMQSHPGANRKNMNLPTVFETCEPREDVLNGTIADADFAADLAKVIRGTASDDYKIPARFFANTYPTAGLKNLLRNVLARLTGDSSAAACIFRLDTSYGGGKTHGLIALTHAANGMKGVSNVAEFVDPKFVPTTKIRIAAFDGENADPANGRSMDDGILAHTRCIPKFSTR
jgi:hypothetical protein